MYYKKVTFVKYLTDRGSSILQPPSLPLPPSAPPSSSTAMPSTPPPPTAMTTPPPPPTPPPTSTLMTIGTTRMLSAVMHEVIPRLWADQPLIQARESVNLVNEAVGALRVGESCNGGGEGYTSPSCDVMWTGRAPTTSPAFSAAARLPSALPARAPPSFPTIRSSVRTRASMRARRAE